MSRVLPDPEKKNGPRLINRRPISRAINGLSADEKKKLLANHTKPTVPPVPTSSTTGARLKKPATAPAPRTNAAKVTKVDRKPLTVAPKIPRYDYKARFNDLLEQHKMIKNDYNDLKHKHTEAVGSYEKLKESKESITREKEILKDKLLDALYEFKERIKELNAIKLDHDKLKRLNEELVCKTEVLPEVTFKLNKKTAEVGTLQEEYNNLTWRHNALREEVQVLQGKSEKLATLFEDYDELNVDYEKAKTMISSYKTEIEKLQNISAGMYQSQRDLRKTIQDVKGNIRIYCRVRPPLESESNKALFKLNVVDACTIEVQTVELNVLTQSRHTFSFNGIFTPNSTQEIVFEEVSNIIQSAVDGFNVCIFAYGPTGSGKTYTMEGGCRPDQNGIIPRAFNFLFTCMEDLKRMGWQLSIKVSFLQIFNEVIYDLLNSCKDQLSHGIKMVNTKGTDIYISDLKEEEVKSSHDLIKLMTYTQRNRQTSATLNNERSSRSHSVTQIKISVINEIRKNKYTSQLNLVDLAGSESDGTTQGMAETKHNDRSVSELSKVILALQTNQAHIPYQNSKLTHLLMPSLGANSKTIMLVNINQFNECFAETLNSLRFATKLTAAEEQKPKRS